MRATAKQRVWNSDYTKLRKLQEPPKAPTSWWTTAPREGWSERVRQEQARRDYVPVAEGWQDRETEGTSADSR